MLEPLFFLEMMKLYKDICVQGFPNSGKGWGGVIPRIGNFTGGGFFTGSKEPEEECFLMIQTFFKAKNTFL